uniref:Uncharacterized protein n=1 Tax=Cyanistes caeruleus TaxID=156563 RepID=A0A8C0ULM4_CYACU
MGHSPGVSQIFGGHNAEMLGPPDPELAATMGFSGFGKKARTFDLEAMFEQTRRTAVERSRKVLGKTCELSRLLHFKTCFDFLPHGDT